MKQMFKIIKPVAQGSVRRSLVSFPDHARSSSFYFCLAMVLGRGEHHSQMCVHIRVCECARRSEVHLRCLPSIPCVLRQAPLSLGPGLNDSAGLGCVREHQGPAWWAPLHHWVYTPMLLCLAFYVGDGARCQMSGPHVAQLTLS